MTNLLENFTDVTDEEIHSLGTGVLRSLADEKVDEFYRFVTLAVLPFDDVTFSREGQLTLMDKVIAMLMDVYRDRGPRVVRRFDSIDIQVYAPDENLRAKLIESRNAQRKLHDLAPGWMRAPDGTLYEDETHDFKREHLNKPVQ